MLLITVAGYTQAISVYNPIVQNLHFTPEPNVYGFQNCSETYAKFNFGMTTQANADSFATQPLKINICLQGFFPANMNPANAVYGPQSQYFNWTYDIISNCLQGIQKDTIFGTGNNIFNLDPRSFGEIAVRLQITPYLPVPALLKVEVALDIPNYMQVGNVNDDQLFAQTQNYIGVTSVAGTLFNDTAIGSTPSGLPNGRPSGNAMFVNVIDVSTGLVEDNVLIDSTGAYFVDSLRPERSYNITVSTVQGINGQPAPPITLPLNWIFVSEDCCDNISNDGFANGLLNVFVNTCPLINANYSIHNTAISSNAESSMFVFLAVDELDFQASEKDCNTILSWQHTANQTIKRYEILRKESTNTNYIKIGELKAQPNSTGNFQYSFVDKNVNKENKLYNYQLSIIDHNERYMLSPIKTIVLDCAGASTVATLYPNPATDKIHFLYDNQTGSEGIRITIMDVAGKTIYKEVKNITPAFNEFTFDITDYPAGYYLMKYEDLDTDQSGTLKFTIK